MRVLLIDRSPPCDAPQGNTLIAYQVFARLARRHEVTLVSFATAEQRQCFEAAGLPFARVHLVPRSKPVNAMMGFAGSLSALVKLPAHGAVQQGFRSLDDAARRALAEERPEVVHVRQFPMAPVGGRLPHHAKLLELIDSETLQNARAVRVTRPRTWLRSAAARLLEPLALEGYEAVTTVAEADAAALRRLRRHADVHVIPNGVDFARFRPTAAVPEPDAILFTGAMSYPPNVDAVQYFHRHVLPNILARRPGARFIVAGRDPSSAIANLASDGVEVTGYVEDMAATIAAASVVVCPMVSGSGIKNKLLEALAVGRPVVATPLAVEGLPLRDGVEVEIARDPSLFAEKVVRLLENAERARSIGSAGRAMAERLFSWDTCANRYEQLWFDLAQSALR